MSKRRSKAASLELTFLAALDSVHADVNTSEIGEIRDWSRAVRGKFHGASTKEPSRLSKLKAGLLSALRRKRAADEPDSAAKSVGAIVLGTSCNMASHRSVQYSQTAIPQLIAECTSESNEAAWHEFIRRFQPHIATVITHAARRFGKVSHELVDDLTQEVFLKLCKDNFRALRSFETYREMALLGFLKVVAANTAHDYFRELPLSKRGSLHEQNDRVLIEHGLSFDTSPELEREILLTEIDATLNTLSHGPNFSRDHAIFWLHYSQGLTAKEIAALPGTKLTVKGVESILLRLTRQIRSALTQKTKNPQ